jgi:hypothetical protein
MSVDPVGFVDNNTMSFNRYLYVNDNPYKYVDPDGEFLNFALKFVLDVAINVAFNYVTTGEMNVGGALKESALGLLNPAKSLAKVGQLASFANKTRKFEKVGERTAAVASKSVKEVGEDLAKVAGKNRVSGRTAGGKQIDIDLAGKAHYEKKTKSLVPTPHVKESTIHTGPNGKTSISDSITRPATMQDVRIARKLLEKQSQ